ncbi:uncharacterized protein LOC133296273 [Gastrolobium bilobum]|uniref:uncharacterized protein LOC133296273 n=1 Tax=Gastrolobium bilobum TaxID=150636 RepID=UPI002AB3027D|nr:uncharacterized protein LOC133296273 [Gastrolobium bilobum]
MFSKYDFLKDVNPAKEDWRIKVKVVLAWKVPNFQRRDFDDNVEMVLLDEQELVKFVNVWCLVGRRKMVVLELDNLSLSADGVESSMRMTQLSTQSSYSYENDFLKETEKKSISDVKLCGEVTTCITYETIKSIESKYNWWYKSCKKCPFFVCEHFEKWYCKNCQKHWEDYYPRFSVQVRVVDNTDSESFLLFDRDCVSLLGMSAGELRELHFKRGADLDQFPEELNVLNEKSMLFKLNIKQKDLNSYSEPKYSVSKNFISKDIISAFIKSLIFEVDPNDEENFEDACENEIVSSELEKVAVTHYLNLY